MVTKPTGRPRGRPRKTLVRVEMPKRPRGRPHMPVSKDPKRQAYAIYKAGVERAAEAGISEQRVAETFVGIAFGRFVPVASNYEALLRGERVCFQLIYDPKAVPARKRWSRLNDESADWRNRNAFRPHADDLRRRVRHIEKRGGADREWLRKMVRIWRICLSRDRQLLREAAQLAEEIGETDVWQNRMLPEYFS
jgi:hypothetical protein